MITTSLEMIQDAQKNNYAIPAINTQGGNYDIIRSICYAAEELRSPIILAHYVKTGDYAGNDWFVEVCKWVANKVSVPVAIHLDHGDDFETCMMALKLGFTSVMIDGSHHSVSENARITNEVIRVAREFGVPVEAEIGEMPPAGSAQTQPRDVDPEEVRKFLSECEPDMLAIGIGNAHGYYTETPKINIGLLHEVRKFSNIPFVLHGCTGMDNDTIREAIKAGVCKINFGTHIRYKYLEHLQKGLDTVDHQSHSWRVFQYTSKQLEQDVKEIIMLSGSAGRAR